MKFTSEKGKIPAELYKLLPKLDKGEYTVEIKKARKARSRKQNDCLHLLFRQWAETLTEAGFDMKKTLKADIDIQWNEERFKTDAWLPVMKAMTGKEHTSDLESHEIDKIFETLNKVIVERTGVFMDFPSIDSLIENNDPERFSN